MRGGVDWIIFLTFFNYTFLKECAAAWTELFFKRFLIILF